MHPPSISVIVPVLNESAAVGRFVEHHVALRGLHEMIMVDGGSTDGTVEILRDWVPRIRLVEIPVRQGRAVQMNAGAKVATGDIFLFLHVDCRLHESALLSVQQALIKVPSCIGGGFLKKYSEESFLLSCYRMIMNGIRTRMLHNLVGTNAIFIRSKVFSEIGGYPETPILEDIMLCDRMKRAGRMVFLTPHVVSSSRRYSKHGMFRRMWIAFRILFMYRVLRTPLNELKRIYTQ